MIRLYILMYTVRHTDSFEDKRVIYEEGERQAWIKEYFRLKKCWYVECLKAFVVKIEAELSDEDMRKENND